MVDPVKTINELFAQTRRQIQYENSNEGREAYFISACAINSVLDLPAGKRKFRDEIIEKEIEDYVRRAKIKENYKITKEELKEKIKQSILELEYGVDTIKRTVQTRPIPHITLTYCL